MEIKADVSEVFKAISENFPKFVKSAMIGAAKALTKTIKQSLKSKTGLTALSEQRKILVKGTPYRNLGGKLINAVTSRYDGSSIKVGFLFKSKKLERFLDGTPTKWQQFNNIALAQKVGTRAPFLKPGTYPTPARPVIDKVATSPETKSMLEKSAYGAVQRSIGLSKTRGKI